MGGVIGEKMGMGRDGPELDPLRVQTQLRACTRVDVSSTKRNQRAKLLTSPSLSLLSSTML